MRPKELPDVWRMSPRAFVYPKMSNPKIIPIKSSHIKALGYDADSRELHIHFNNGTTGIHHDVPAQVYYDLLDSNSKGQFYHKNIKGKDYRWQKTSA